MSRKRLPQTDGAAEDVHRSVEALVESLLPAAPSPSQSPVQSFEEQP